MEKEENFDDIKQEQQKRLESINKWNNAMKGSGYQPTLEEEMNINGVPTYGYVGKGHF